MWQYVLQVVYQLVLTFKQLILQRDRLRVFKIE
jgi:hypothetical protein